MTNKEFLDKKFPEHTPMSGFHDQAYDQRDYLLKQINWMHEYWIESWQGGEGITLVRCFPPDGPSFQSEGSCLLEAIENAQKELSYDCE